jgi:predicted nucleic-acid-binding protein
LSTQGGGDNSKVTGLDVTKLSLTCLLVTHRLDDNKTAVIFEGSLLEGNSKLVDCIFEYIAILLRGKEIEVELLFSVLETVIDNSLKFPSII